MVAVVEDDESYRLALRRLLKSAGFPVQSFTSAEEFLNSGRQQETGCLIADIRMPGMSGLGSSGKVERGSLPDSHYFRYGTWRRKNAVAGDERRRSEIPRQAI